MSTPHKWTSEEDERVEYLHNEQGMTYTRIAQMMGVSRVALASHLYDMRHPTSGKHRADFWWTEDEVNTLIELYQDGRRFDFISRQIGRSPGACSMKVAELHRDGRIQRRQHRWTDEETYAMKQMMRDGDSAADVAKRLGIDVKMVQGRIHYLRLKELSAANFGDEPECVLDPLDARERRLALAAAQEAFSKGMPKRRLIRYCAKAAGTSMARMERELPRLLKAEAAARRK